MNKMFRVLTLIVFLFVSGESFAEEPQCDGSGSLDLELEDEEAVPEVLKTLSDKTFHNYTREVLNCEDGSKYEYVLDEQFVWDLRFELYEAVLEDMKTCHCVKELDDFRECMVGVRAQMAEILDGWDAIIDKRLDEIEKEAEEECTVTAVE